MTAAGNLKLMLKQRLQLQFLSSIMMNGVSLETCSAIKKHWNNKFYYTVASFFGYFYGFI